MKLIISVDGNIGSGKTTFIRHLKKKYSDLIEFVDEPINEWLNTKNSEGKSILSLYYNDQKRWSFAFQIYAMHTRTIALQDVIKNSKKQIIVTERSTNTDAKVFTEMLYTQNKITDMEYIIYKKLFDSLLIKADAIIYIKTDANKCLDRLIKRNRSGEKIELSYLEKLHDVHEKWIKNTKWIWTINGNENYFRSKASEEKIFDTFIQKTKKWESAKKLKK